MPVHKRGDTWWVSVSVGGRRIRKSAGRAATRADAKRLEAKILQDAVKVRRGEKPDRTLSEALVEWLTQHEDKRTREHVRALYPYVKGRLLKDAHIVAREAKQGMLAAGRAAATINRRLAILRAVANLAYREWEWLDEPVGKKISLLPVNNERHVYLEPVEVAALAAACPNPNAGSFVLLAAYTGLRRGELFRANDGHAIARDGLLMLDAKTKTGRPRVIPVPAEVEHIVSQMPLPLSLPQLRKSWDKARKACGMPNIRFHDLRHTYASWLVQAKVPLRTVQELMGHTTMAMTQRYSHLADEHLREAVDMMRSRHGEKTLPETATTNEKLH
jgi:integrase